MHKTTFYLVRHGETDWNSQGKLQGQQDIPLNASGIAQAEELKKKLTDLEFDHVYSSDLSRAIHTATILHDRPPIQDKILRERTFGPYEGLSSQQFRMEYYLKHNVSDTNDPDMPFLHKWHPEVESTAEVIERISSFCGKKAQELKGNVLIVSHGGVLRSLVKHYKPEWPPCLFHNCGYITLEWVHPHQFPSLTFGDGVEFVPSKEFTW